MYNLSVYLTLKSKNSKVGPIPVSTTSKSTCPTACPLKDAGCYADMSNLGMLWNSISKVKAGRKFKWGRGGTIKTLDWDAFCAKIAAIPVGTLWRHNQAGDLPGMGNSINQRQLKQLVKANHGKRGFTYTHKPMTKENIKAIREANASGFTINLSGNTLDHADKLVRKNIAPVVTLLSANHGNRSMFTADGNLVIVCPATYRDDTTCKNCQLCAVPHRKAIIGFPAHGAGKKAVTKVALGVTE